MIQRRASTLRWRDDRTHMSKHRRKAPSQRQLRVGEQLRHILAEVIGRGTLRDPVLVDKSITVSQIRVSPDMRNATAFVMPLGGTASAADVVAALNRASHHLAGELARRITLKYTPALRFEIDTVFDEAERIDALLRAPGVARDLRRDDGKTGARQDDDA